MWSRRSSLQAGEPWRREDLRLWSRRLVTAHRGCMTVMTVRQVQHALADEGYRERLVADGPRLRVESSGTVHLPADLVVARLVRLQGITGPEEEALVFALATPRRAACGHLRATIPTGEPPGRVSAIRTMPTTQPADLPIEPQAPSHAPRVDLILESPCSGPRTTWRGSLSSRAAT